MVSYSHFHKNESEQQNFVPSLTFWLNILGAISMMVVTKMPQMNTSVSGAAASHNPFNWLIMASTTSGCCACETVSAVASKVKPMHNVPRHLYTLHSYDPDDSHFEPFAESLWTIVVYSLSCLSSPQWLNGTAFQKQLDLSVGVPWQGATCSNFSQQRDPLLPPQSHSIWKGWTSCDTQHHVPCVFVFVLCISSSGGHILSVHTWGKTALQCFVCDILRAYLQVQRLCANYDGF